MRCLRGGAQPQLGRTIDMLGGHRTSAAASSSPSPDIVYDLHLTDVYVSLAHDPREPIEIPLIEGGTAIAAFVGLLPGGSWSAVVHGGKRVNHLQVGMKVRIQGKLTNSGKPFSIPAVLDTKDAGDPARFVEPPRG